MSVLQAEVHEAFRSIDVPDDKAPKAAVASLSAMSRGEDEAMKYLKRVEEEATKHCSKRDADIDAIRKDVTILKIDSAVMKWMLGSLLVTQVAVFVKAFIR